MGHVVCLCFWASNAWWVRSNLPKLAGILLPTSAQPLPFLSKSGQTLLGPALLSPALGASTRDARGTDCGRMTSLTGPNLSQEGAITNAGDSCSKGRRQSSSLLALLMIGVAIGEAGGGCQCHQSPGLVAILPNPITDGGNEITCQCTVWATGTCTAGCANQQSDGGGPCPATFTINAGPVGTFTNTNCNVAVPKICLPPGMNPQLPGCTPAPAIPACPVDPATFCKNQCTQLGLAVAELNGDACIDGVPLQTPQVIGIPMPATAGGPVVQDFAECNLPCSAQPCTTTNLLTCNAASSAFPDAGCCTVLDTCSVTDGPFCAPNGDPVGIFSEFFSQTSKGEVDPGSYVTMSLSGSDGGQTHVLGSLSIIGRPCTDGSCGVGFAFDLLPQPVQTPGLSLSDIQINGSTQTPGSVTLVNGSGSVDLSDLDVTAAAKGEGCAFLVTLPIVGTVCLFGVSGSGAVEESPQPELGAPPPILTVDFPGHAFDLRGTFHFSGDSADHIPAFDLEADLSGKLVNEPPAANAGASQTVECSSPQGALVTLDGTGSTDPDNNIASYSWHQGDPVFGQPLGGTAVLQVEAPFNGTGNTATNYGLWVTDALGQMDTASTSVTVKDTLPPAIRSISVQPSCLWPPNHGMVLFQVGKDILVDATDPCDPSPIAFIKEVQDNQPTLGGGSGNTTPDFEFGSAAMCLRAERDGTRKTSRIYTVTIGVLDHAGNEADGTIEVVVPHDQAGVRCPNLPVADFVTDDDPACAASLDGGVPAAHDLRQPVSAPNVQAPVQIVRDHGCGTAPGGRFLAPGWLAIGLLVLRRRRGSS